MAVSRFSVSMLVVLSCGLAVPPARASSETVLSGRLTLDDAVKIAIDNNLDLKSAYQQREVARGRRLEAWGEALPKIDLLGRYEYTGKTPGIQDEASGQFVPFGVQNNTALDLSLRQPLWQGGRGAAALRASKLYASFTEEELRAAVQAVVYRTSLAYWSAIVGAEERSVAENALRLAETHLKDVETKKKFGVASEFNVLRSQVEVANATTESIVFKNRVHLARTELFRAMGVSQDSEVELADGLVYAPLDAQEADELRTAFAERPEIALADYGARLQKEAVAVAKSDFSPRIEAFLGATYAKPNPSIYNLNEFGSQWRAGVNLTFPVFDGLARKGRLVQEKARLAQREIQADDARERARSEVRAALMTLEDAAEAVDSQKKTVEQANEGLRLAEVGYREGTLDQVAVIDARLALTRVQLLFSQSVYRHVVAKIDLERVRGTLGAAFQPPGTTSPAAAPGR